MSASSSMSVCPACDHQANFRAFVVREMQFGTLEEFDYRECSDCGTMHIAAVPADLSRHYPGKYYSFLPTRARHHGVPLFRKFWSHWVVSSPNPLAAAIASR